MDVSRSACPAWRVGLLTKRGSVERHAIPDGGKQPYETIVRRLRQVISPDRNRIEATAPFKMSQGLVAGLAPHR